MRCTIIILEHVYVGFERRAILQRKANELATVSRCTTGVDA